IIALISCVAALVGLARLHFTSRTILPLGPSGAGPSQVSDQAHWRDSARLTLTFDSAPPSAIRQEGVQSYQWHSLLSVRLKWSTQSVSLPAGYTLIFLQFTEPTRTDNWRVRVDNGSTDDRVLTTSATGAVVQAMGDLLGKKVDIRFS